MAFSLDPGRQYPLVAAVFLEGSDLQDGPIEAITLPKGAVLLSMRAAVVTGFESFFSDTVDSIDDLAKVSIGDGTSGTLFVDAASVASAGVLSVTATAFGKKYTDGGVVVVHYFDQDTLDSPIDAGQLAVEVKYVIPERVNEIQV